MRFELGEDSIVAFVLQKERSAAVLRISFRIEDFHHFGEGDGRLVWRFGVFELLEDVFDVVEAVI